LYNNQTLQTQLTMNLVCILDGDRRLQKLRK